MPVVMVRPILDLFVSVGIEGEVQLTVLVLHLALYDCIHITILEVRANQIHIDVVRDVVASSVVDCRF